MFNGTGRGYDIRGKVLGRVFVVVVIFAEGVSLNLF